MIRAGSPLISHTKRPLRVAITGGIGTGKSTVVDSLLAAAAAQPRLRGRVQAYSADAAVHGLLQVGGPLWPQLLAAFPTLAAVCDLPADQQRVALRERLGWLTFPAPWQLAKLQRLLYPALATARRAHGQQARRQGALLLLWEIPLLLEAGLWREVEVIVQLKASPRVQAARVLARQSFTPAKLRLIRARQWGQARKNMALAAAQRAGKVVVVLRTDVAPWQLRASLLQQLRRWWHLLG